MVIRSTLLIIGWLVSALQIHLRSITYLNARIDVDIDEKAGLLPSRNLILLILSIWTSCGVNLEIKAKPIRCMAGDYLELRVICNQTTWVFLYMSIYALP